MRGASRIGYMSAAKEKCFVELSFIVAASVEDCYKTLGLFDLEVVFDEVEVLVFFVSLCAQNN